MKAIWMFVLILLFASGCLAQRCDSYVSAGDGWRPIASAPRNGTIIEVAETYGIAPWYGLFKWTKDQTAIGQDGKIVHFKSTDASWVRVDKPGAGVSEDSCLYWRPYKENSNKYSDPTKGRQDSVKYWCDAMHLSYDAKHDRCIAK